MKGICKAVFVFCFALLRTGFPQQGLVTLTTDKLTPNIYMVKGGVANTGFIVGKKEVIAIDAEITTEMTKQMMAEIRKVTPNPVTKVILTHTDRDHVNGLAGFPAGLEVISTLAARKELEVAFKAPDLEALLPYVPSRTYKDKMELQLDGEEIQLLHFGPAHTNGDTVVFFPAQRLAFVGDVVLIKGPPMFHDQEEKKGSSFGMVKAAKQLLALEADRYISGHDRVLSKSDIIEGDIKVLEEMQAKVKAMIQEGKTRDDVKKAFGVTRYPNLPELIYRELTEKW
jgi:cyclase